MKPNFSNGFVLKAVANEDQVLTNLRLLLANDPQKPL